MRAVKFCNFFVISFSILKFFIIFFVLLSFYFLRGFYAILTDQGYICWIMCSLLTLHHKFLFFWSSKTQCSSCLAVVVGEASCSNWCINEKIYNYEGIKKPIKHSTIKPLVKIKATTQLLICDHCENVFTSKWVFMWERLITKYLWKKCVVETCDF